MKVKSNLYHNWQIWCSYVVGKADRRLVFSSQPIYTDCWRVFWNRSCINTPSWIQSITSHIDWQMSDVATQIFWKLWKPVRVSWYCSNCSDGSVCCHSNWDKTFPFWKCFLAEQMLDQNLKQDLDFSCGAFYKIVLFLLSLSLSTWKEWMDGFIVI